MLTNTPANLFVPGEQGWLSCNMITSTCRGGPHKRAEEVAAYMKADVRRSSAYWYLLLLSVLIFLSMASACTVGGPEPSALIPPESDAWIAIRRTDRLSQKLRPVVEVVPEAAGAVDLLRSMTGINPVDPDQTAESGLDPARGSAAAWWHRGTLIILPVSDAPVAGRRIGLRMARFGFVESDPDSPMRTFKSASGDRACVVVASGVAVVFVGKADVCPELTDLIQKGQARAKSAEYSLTAPVTSELGLADADIVAYAGNEVFAQRLMKLAGLPVKGPGAYVVQGMVGDARAAIVIGKSIQVRVAAGSSGDPFEPVSERPPVRAGDAITVNVTADQSVRPLFESALAMCGKRCRKLGLETLNGMWDGRAMLTVPSSVAASANSAGVFRPVRSIRDFFKRVNVSLIVGTGKPGPQALAILRQQFPVSPDSSPSPDLSGQSDVAVLSPTPVPAGMPDPLVTPVTSEPVKVQAAGLEIVLGAREKVVIAASGPGAADAISKAVSAASPLELSKAGGGKLVSVDVSPEGVLQVSGASNIDFLRHLVDPVRNVELDVYLGDGRLVADGRVNIR
jgi:hypothetical protein